jgi:hypothetical protein
LIRVSRVQSGVDHHEPRDAAGVLLVFAWAFWLNRWVPALLVVGFVVWVFLHHRLEAGLGEVLQRQWRRAWPPRAVVLTALLVASALAFVLLAGPAISKVVPVGLGVLALSMTFFGAWWRLVTLPRWLGGPGSSLGFGT